MSPALETQSWTTDARVTLLEDAAHPMPPVGGVGANVAFQDAADEMDVLIEGPPGTESMGRYDEVVRERAGKALIQSASGAGHFFGMKPLEELKPSTLWT